MATYDTMEHRRMSRSHWSVTVRRGESASTMEPGATPDVPCNEHFTAWLLTAMEERRPSDRHGDRGGSKRFRLLPTAAL